MRIKIAGPAGFGVREDDTATLRGLTGKTLRNRWATDRPLEAHFIGRQRCYDFGTLAAFIARRDAEAAE
jgi:hypothetical protein